MGMQGAPEKRITLGEAQQVLSEHFLQVSAEAQRRAASRSYINVPGLVLDNLQQAGANILGYLIRPSQASGRR